jgi:hypothetical protein
MLAFAIAIVTLLVILYLLQEKSKGRISREDKSKSGRKALMLADTDQRIQRIKDEIEELTRPNNGDSGSASHPDGGLRPTEPSIGDGGTINTE